MAAALAALDEPPDVDVYHPGPMPPAR